LCRRDGKNLGRRRRSIECDIDSGNFLDRWDYDPHVEAQIENESGDPCMHDEGNHVCGFRALVLERILTAPESSLGSNGRYRARPLHDLRRRILRGKRIIRVESQ
jgi:hypothetical protein